MTEKENEKNEDMNKLQDVIKKAYDAQKIFASFSQDKVDRIFRKAALAANDARIKLAKMAVEETQMGILEDKVIKNHFASEYIYNEYKDTKTCGVIEDDTSFGVKKIAEPIGVLAGIVPTTNPTSTAIFKALIALKTRNAIVFSPHPRAKGCTIEAANIILKAAIEAGAPEGIIGWIDTPSVALSNHLMQNVNLILATGGPGMVKAAYSSGRPAIGVGAGNTPAVIDETAHIKMAVNSILISKTFDNGVICASEQSVIVAEQIYDQVKQEFLDRGAYILNNKEKEKVAAIILNERGVINAAIVGQPAYKIAELAGIKVDESIKVLIGEVESTEQEEPFSYEKLSPILAMYKYGEFEEALTKAARLIELGGFGHTSVLYTDQDNNKDRIDAFGNMMKTGRVIINMPAAHGAIGDIYNFKLPASLTLGCGSWGGNSVSENVGVKHLLNIKTIAERRENMLWFRVPPKVYFKAGSLPVALEELKGEKKRALIVTDNDLYRLGFANKITDILDGLDIESSVFYEVEPDPTLATARKGAEIMKTFAPDVIIALGGGSAMDAAKIMWVLYEHPNVKFADLALRFMDIRKRIYAFPKMGKKATLIAVPTSAGTGSEVTPFAVITDEKTGFKYPLADYELTPNMAIVDPNLMMTMPPKLCAYSGVDALTHAIEGYVSVVASDYTNGMALEAIRLIFKYLPDSYRGGATAVKAKEKMAYASTMAGMVFANAFLGVCHSMAHKLGAMFHVPHGLANALLINETIKFNSSDSPRKQAAFPQYKYPQAKFRYARIADYLGLGGNNSDEKTENLIKAINDLKKAVDIPAAIKDLGISQKDFDEKLEEMSELAFDDQCTGANPRYPLIKEITEMYLSAYNG